MKKDLTHRMDPRRQRRRGFTLTEIAIVLGIVGLILGAIWVAAAAVYNNLRTSHTNTAILQTAQAVRTLMATQSQFAPVGTDNTKNMITAGVTPSDMVNAAGTGLTNAWGGDFYVTSTTDGVGIVLELDGVPEANCIDLVSMVAGNTRDSGLFLAELVGLGAIGTAAKIIAAVASPLTAAVAPTTAAAPAGTACVAGMNFIEFGFLLKG